MVRGRQDDQGHVLPSEVKAINVGLTSFAQALNQQGVTVIHVDWKPPAGGNAHLIELLKKMKA